MKKGYYFIIALSMAILMIAYSPIVSYASQNLTATLDFSDNGTSNVEWRLTSRVTSYVLDGDDTEATSVAADHVETVTFKFNVQCNIIKQPGTNSNPAYANGYVLYTVKVPFDLLGAVSGGGDIWSADYTVDYGTMFEGVSTCLSHMTQTHGSGSGNKYITLFIYTFFDNVYLEPNYEILSNVNANITITARKTSSGLAEMTLLQPVITSQGISVDSNPNPVYATGFSRVLNLAVEKAIQNSTDIDDIISLLIGINTMFPQYMDNVLTHLSQIRNTLNNIYIQDDKYYGYIIDFLSEYSRDITEEQTEQYEVESQYEELETYFEQTEPDLSEVYSLLDLKSDPQSGIELFYFLHNNNVIIGIVLTAMALAIISYLLYGKGN